LACTCGNLQEANDQSYLPHPLGGHGFYTKVDIRGRHERGKPKKLWLFCDMKRMSEWRIHSTTTSQAELKEWESWCCLLKTMTALGASLIK
jgi:hypothetical protein